MTVAAELPSTARALARFARHPSARALTGLAAVAVFLLAWQIVGGNEIIRSDLISYPSEIAQTLARMTASGELRS
jgi:ABC-type nitrate/sulfonate/bicarbonate transport system permease component